MDWQGEIRTGTGGWQENAAAGYKHFIGGFPALYTRSQHDALEADITSGAFARRSQYSGSHADENLGRSFFGLDDKGRALLVAVGQGSIYDRGLSLVAGARLLRELGAREAYVLDGGFSTTIYVRGVEHARTDGRQVWSYLGVRAKQGEKR